MLLFVNRHSSILNGSFVDKHHGNVIPDGVNAAAFHTFEASAIWSEFQLFLA